MSTDPIADYASQQDLQRAQICNTLQSRINASLPQATCKLWHSIPVWFIGENPVVGYTARKTGVMLMFWNGKHFDEPQLNPSGSFHMAEIPYVVASEIDDAKLAGWLAKAATSIWDMVGERKAAVAKRGTKSVKAKPKPVKAKTKPAKAKKTKPAKKADQRKPVRRSAKAKKRARKKK